MIQTPETPNNRLDQLEATLGRFAELVIQNTHQMNNTVDKLTVAVNRSSQNIDNLTAQAAEDRQQAAIDRQAWQAEIERIWQHLQKRGKEHPKQKPQPIALNTIELEHYLIRLVEQKVKEAIANPSSS